jgi:hypothetical protein
MSPQPRPLVDRIYLAACGRDARLTRICLASVRYFYPDAPIEVLAGDILQLGLARELKKHWGVEVTALPRGDYGPGFIKLEPLFGPPGQRFMVLDVDTVFVGRVLDACQTDAPFVVDDEQGMSDADRSRLYFNWQALASIDPAAPGRPWGFNVGHWFGTAGVIDRAAFDPWVEWTMPRRLRHPDVFMVGDQGVLNYILLQKEAREGLRVDRRTIMRWPGHSLDGIDAAAIAAGTAPPVVVHWAGMKAMLLRDMAGSDVLHFFENYYFQHLPLGGARRRLALWRHVWVQWSYEVTRRIKLRWRIWFKPRPPSAPPRLVTDAISQ